jgi:DNA modification methylase
MRVRLIGGDCLAALRRLPSGGVSHVVTDPPYGQSNEAYDRGVDPDVWRECYRVTGPNAALISFAGSPTYHRIASDIEAAGWKVRQMWAWIYRDGLITSAWPREGFDRLAPAMDPICYATKGKVLLNLERVGRDEWVRPARPAGSYSARAAAMPTQASSGHWPRCVVSDGETPDFDYFALSRSGRSPEKVGHPNQKPLALMAWLVGKLPAGGAILDPFAGSGTTLVAAAEAGFDAIGVELDPDYRRLARRRVRRALAAAEAVVA